MGRLIFTDFDYTLVNFNLEKEFLLYFLKNERKQFGRVSYNFLLHNWFKYVQKLKGRKYTNIKYYYRGFSKDYIINKLNSFIKEYSNNFMWNKSILGEIDKKKDTLIILTMCPAFICENFCELYLGKYKWKLYGTLLHTFQGKFSGKVKLKLTNSVKRNICESETKKNRKSGFSTVGYGDSENDLGFLDLLDKSYCFQNFIEQIDSNIIYMDPIWSKIDYLLEG